MATQSAAAPAIASVDSGPAKTTDDGNALAEEGAADDISPKSVFVNSQTIRENPVQNAVTFLSHPKVRGSPVIHRRNFLEKKGLTKEEIDEAFCRVPDPSPLATNVQGGQLTAASEFQQRASVQALQPLTTAPSGAQSTLTRQFLLSHAFLAIGFLVASGAGAVMVLRNAIIPRLKSWIRKVAFDQDKDPDKSISSRPNVAVEVAAAAKAAASAAADVANASQEMLITKNEAELHKFMSLLDGQLQEIKSMKSAVHKLEEMHAGKRLQVEDEYLGDSLAPSKNGGTVAEFNPQPVSSSSPAASVEPPHPKSFMEIMEMVQRGEKPSNIREINDLPPNPNHPISNPSLAPRPKPWEINQPANSSSSRFGPRPPFINGGSSSRSQTSGVSYQSNNDGPFPWWQQQRQQQQKNTTITEVESENNFSAPSNGRLPVDPLPRKWVPPQLQPVAHPEATLAIRQPKSAANRVVDNVSSPLNGIIELDRITVVSESGGQNENGGGSGMGSAGEMHGENPAENSFIAPSNAEAAIDLAPQLQRVLSPPPTVEFPEAALGIEQPKSFTAKDCLVDDVSSPLVEIDEADRITYISESDEQKANGRGSDVSEKHSDREAKDSFLASSDDKIDIDPPPQLQRVPSPTPPVALPEVVLGIEQFISASLVDHLETEASLIASSNGEATIDTFAKLQRVPSPPLPVAVPEAAFSTEQPKSPALVDDLSDNATLPINEVKELH